MKIAMDPLYPHFSWDEMHRTAITIDKKCYQDWSRAVKKFSGLS